MRMDMMGHCTDWQSNTCDIDIDSCSEPSSNKLKEIYIYTGSYLCVFIRVWLTSSILLLFWNDNTMKPQRTLASNSKSLIFSLFLQPDGVNL